MHTRALNCSYRINVKFLSDTELHIESEKVITGYLGFWDLHFSE